MRMSEQNFIKDEFTPIRDVGVWLHKENINLFGWFSYFQGNQHHNSVIDDNLGYGVYNRCRME